MSEARWHEYVYFSRNEFNCKHTGRNEMQHEFLIVLEELRGRYKKPIRVTSGYRHKTHPLEINKSRPGEHTRGLCADLAVTKMTRYELVQIAFEMHIPRIGLSDTFIHLGIDKTFPYPRIWTYK